MLKGHLCSIYISPRRSLLHIKWMLKYWCVASSYECSKMTLASLWLNLVHLPSIEAHWCTFAIHWCTHQSKQPKSSNLSTWNPSLLWVLTPNPAAFGFCEMLLGLRFPFPMSCSKCLQIRPTWYRNVSANARPNETLSGEWVVFLSTTQSLERFYLGPNVSSLFPIRSP